MDRFRRSCLTYLPHKVDPILLASVDGPVFAIWALGFWGRLSKGLGLPFWSSAFCPLASPRVDGPMCWLAGLVGWTQGGWLMRALLQC